MKAHVTWQYRTCRIAQVYAHDPMLFGISQLMCDFNAHAVIRSLSLLPCSINGIPQIPLKLAKHQLCMSHMGTKPTRGALARKLTLGSHRSHQA
jgi:hypothetical protein